MTSSPGVVSQVQQVWPTNAATTERRTSAAADERRQCAFCSSLASAVTVANFSTTNNHSEQSQAHDHYIQIWDNLSLPPNDLLNHTATLQQFIR